MSMAPDYSGDFTNYFLAFPRGFQGQDIDSMSNEDKSKLLARREGVLELCHNWGTGKLYVVHRTKETSS
jgi:lactoylglutathione lyase